MQDLTIGGNPTGGTFTLSTLAPLPVGTTPPIAYSATADEVQQALALVLGNANISVTEPLPGTFAITFQGLDADEAIPNLIPLSDLTGGSTRSVQVQTVTAGGALIGNPTLISSVPNSTAAIDGNNAQIRVVLDGNQTGGATGLVLNTSQSVIRGLAIEAFGIGISVPEPDDVGDLIQGNSIGEYLVYPVDPLTGIALLAPNNVALAGLGNTQQGISLGSANATIGGNKPQDANVISGNGAQGVLLMPGASGNQILGNQIGVVGPSSNGLYFPAGNGSDGVAIESSGTASDPSGIVYSSSNVIGGARRARATSFRRITALACTSSESAPHVTLSRPTTSARHPAAATRSAMASPAIRPTACGSTTPRTTMVGGPAAADGNVISSNKGAGVYVTGADATGNSIENNIIGLTAAGTAVLGNDRAGVADYSPGTLIGPGNVISDNQIGVLISGRVGDRRHRPG